MLRGLELVNGTKNAERNASTRHTFTRPIGAGGREGGISFFFFCFLCLVNQGDAIQFLNPNLPRELSKQASEIMHACLHT